MNIKQLKLTFLITILLSMVGVKAFAHDIEYNGIYFNIFSTDSRLVSVTYKGNSYDEYANEYSGDIVIPICVFIDGETYSVMGINDYAFRDCSGLKSVRFGEEAFSSLSPFLLGDGIFMNCNNLTSVYFTPCSMDAISPNNYFYTNISSKMFYGCSNLTSISIPEGVEYVGYDVFYGCNKLSAVVIPSTVTDIKFYGCNNITKVVVKSDQPWNIQCYIPNQENATLYVPVGCTEAYESEEFWRDFKDVVEMRDIVFADERVEATCVKYWDTNNDWKLNEEEAAAVTEINQEFQNMTNITSFDELKYFSGLKKIGDEAFYYCQDLESITIPAGVTSIGDYAFEGCWKLSKYNRIINLKEWCEKGDLITYGSGSSDPTFSNIRYKDLVTKLLHLYSDFDTEIKELVIPDGIYSICQNAFSGYSGLTSVTIGNDVHSIAVGAFDSCSKLTKVSIGNSVTNISGNPFRGCSSLSDIFVENGNAIYDSRNGCNAIIETVSNKLISGCKNTIIPNGVVSIVSSAFSGCSGLTSITIPNSVTSIDRYAFMDCCGLTSVTIGSGIEDIGNDAFAYCPELKDVYCLAEQVPTVEGSAFSNSNIGNATLHVPFTSINAFKNTSPWKDFKEIVEIGGKCATPTISHIGDKLKFSCETEGVSFYYQITPPPSSESEGEDVSLPTTYTVTVYAKKDGYENSDLVTKVIDVRGLEGDVNQDGVVNVADHVKLSEIILNQK